MNGDEQLLNRFVYGADHDDPNPGALPHRTYAELVGGPLDGLLLDIHGWRTEEAWRRLGCRRADAQQERAPGLRSWSTATAAGEVGAARGLREILARDVLVHCGQEN